MSKSTLHLSGQALQLCAVAGKVLVNGQSLDPHEAYLMGFELQRMADVADMLAAKEQREKRYSATLEACRRYEVAGEGDGASERLVEFGGC